MEQYIPKSALVAEIKRLQDAHKDQLFRNLFTTDFIGGIEAASDQILSYINTLEVKEVDLEKETEHVKGDYEQADVAWNKDNNMKYIDADKLKAEIESIGLIPQISADYNDGRNDMKIMFLDTIDSLQQEQPEVDLEKELNDYGYHYDYVSLADRKELVDFAKHFFELGINAQKGNEL